jgi:hypothetical protein
MVWWRASLGQHVSQRTRGAVGADAAELDELLLRAIDAGALQRKRPRACIGRAPRCIRCHVEAVLRTAT